MDLARVAWRNLNRNTVRTAVAVLAVATVVAIVIFARGLMEGSVESSFGMYIDNNFGHVRITHDEYAAKEALLPLDYTIDGLDSAGADAMIDELEGIDIVQGVLPRIRFPAVVQAADSVVRMVGVGIEPTREQKHGALSGDVAQGRMPQTDKEILVGSGLLHQLDAEPGDQISIIFSDAGESPQEVTFDVVGSRESGVSGLDDSFFYLPLETARGILGLGDEATEMLIFSSQAGLAGDLQGEVDALLVERGSTDYTTVVWNQADAFVEFFYEMTRIMDLVYVMFIVMGAVVLSTTLTMVVRERTSEIGMMAALGLTSRDIVKVFTLEGIFMGLIGSLLGTAAGGLLTYHYSQAGLYAEEFAMLSTELDLLIEPVFYFAFSFQNLMASFAMGVVVVAFACLYPAYQAAKLKPVDALHFIDE